MARIRVSTIIDAAPKEVWEDVRHLGSHPEWMADAVALRFMGSQIEGVGTRFECDTKVGPFRLTDVMEVTEWKPGRSIGVAHRGLVTGRGRFTLRRTLGGGTRFQWKERLRFPWWMGGPFGAFAAKPLLRRIWRRSMLNLTARF